MIIYQNLLTRAAYAGGVNSSLEDARPDVGSVDSTSAGGNTVRSDGTLGSKGIDSSPTCLESRSRGRNRLCHGGGHGRLSLGARLQDGSSCGRRHRCRCRGGDDEGGGCGQGENEGGNALHLGCLAWLLVDVVVWCMLRYEGGHVGAAQGSQMGGVLVIDVGP